MRRYLGEKVYDLFQEVKEGWNVWNIKCGDNDGGEGGTRDQMEWGEERLNGEEESDHEQLVSLVKEFQGDPSDGNEEYESEESGQENSLRSYWGNWRDWWKWSKLGWRPWRWMGMNGLTDLLCSLTQKDLVTD